MSFDRKPAPQDVTWFLDLNENKKLKEKITKLKNERN